LRWQMDSLVLRYIYKIEYTLFWHEVTVKQLSCYVKEEYL
jgi:hypothetical protein